MKLNANSLNALREAMEDHGGLRPEDVALTEAYIDIVNEFYPEMEMLLQSQKVLQMFQQWPVGTWTSAEHAIGVIGMGLTAWGFENVADDDDIPDRDLGDSWSPAAFTEVIGEERIDRIKFGVQGLSHFLRVITQMEKMLRAGILTVVEDTESLHYPTELEGMVEYQCA